MTREKIEAAPGITCYRDPLGSRVVQFYALEDPDGYTLIDTAIPGFVTAWLDEGGLTGDIRRVIISHSDADHFGDTAALKERFPQLQAVCHALDQRWIEEHDVIVRERYDHARLKHNYGYDQETLKILRDLCGPNFKIDQTVTEGNTLTIGARTWTVLHVPGHSPGHIALWSEADGILILGDAVLGYGPPDTAGQVSMPSTHQFIADYLNTINRLEALPVKLVLSGHWPFLGAEAFKQLLSESRERVRLDLETILQACGEKPQSYADLMTILNAKFRVWPESEDTSYIFALSGSLDYLLEQGSLAESDGRFTTMTK